MIDNFLYLLLNLSAVRKVITPHPELQKKGIYNPEIHTNISIF